MAGAVQQLGGADVDLKGSIPLAWSTLAWSRKALAVTLPVLGSSRTMRYASETVTRPNLSTTKTRASNSRADLQQVSA